MTGYESGSGEIGLAAFVARAEQLAEAYGDRFRPTDRLREMAESGESFPA
jgi:3-hydroxyacyl-CoA dehydrogenase/enoyl-CoA hydratase/3-hydroxybutyryl-CoA epimerase